jgi:signal transduction histidine kinase
VSLSRTPTHMYVEVSDDGRASPSSAADSKTGASDSGSTGNGLRGLAERVTAAGGTFEAGPRAGGGFRLAVTIPFVSTSRAGEDADVPVESPAAAEPLAAPTAPTAPPAHASTEPRAAG